MTMMEIKCFEMNWIYEDFLLYTFFLAVKHLFSFYFVHYLVNAICPYYQSENKQECVILSNIYDSTSDKKSDSIKKVSHESSFHFTILFVLSRTFYFWCFASSPFTIVMRQNWISSSIAFFTCNNNDNKLRYDMHIHCDA